MQSLSARQAAGEASTSRAPSSRSAAPARRTSVVCSASSSSNKEVTLLDYGAGNVRSVRNAIKKLGYTIRDVESAADLASASKLVFPGVGSYGQAMTILTQKGLVGPLRDYIHVSAVQFHPEKSGATGLDILQGFLEPEAAVAARKAAAAAAATSSSSAAAAAAAHSPRGLAKRVIACLDVRSNDAGDLVVTKGDQYDVREKGDAREVRNLGKPVDLAARYFEEGADEVAFLNITGFRDCVMEDTPMLEVLRRASERVFVPLTVGGGIKALTDSSGRTFSAVEVAAEYFRSGADKVSIGSDAVDAAQAYYARGAQADGSTAIEQISAVYGKQAVVISIDPRRVYVSDPAAVPHATVQTSRPGPAGEQYCWWQCTVKGGREGRDLGAVELARAVEALGAGEILLNCIDNDGVGQGFDLELVDAVSRAVTIPVIASSGAGCPQHFSQVFRATGAAAALAAGIFHRREVGISEVKAHLAAENIPARI
ncbi:hypothetical protein CHLRE_11g481500v5 [Chlamydomonas reinhardtii]|uniref:Uncharacterized protein n=1 Tax=Chlamydomonas reinhardtii TaxID=3055 RepID=A0A2K3D8R8_CHLRE|nr:uncharacterized protein CHLRE_11g481500v5 [Chlamydomonas reinhardtii]PNW76928.1 hypothetical protein CHLRE_11g481500v5 [Chlamydomonas reinhardtii]